MENHERILLVEDSPADAILVREAFRRAEISNPLKHVETGQDALDHLQDGENLPLLVLLDLNLPGIDGRQVLREIRESEETKSLPVLILSTSDHPEDISTCYTLGANSYMVKPTSLADMNKTFSHFRDFWLDVAKLPQQP